MGREDYSTIIRADIESPKSVLIVPKLLIKNVTPFEKEVKAICNTLVVSPINSAANYNIANKINKQKSKNNGNIYIKFHNLFNFKFTLINTEDNS